MLNMHLQSKLFSVVACKPKTQALQADACLRQKPASSWWALVGWVRRKFFLLYASLTSILPPLPPCWFTSWCLFEGEGILPQHFWLLKTCFQQTHVPFIWSFCNICSAVFLSNFPSSPLPAHIYPLLKYWDFLGLHWCGRTAVCWCILVLAGCQN